MPVKFENLVELCERSCHEFAGQELRGMKPELPALQHVIGLELPASDDHSYAALLAVGRQRPVPAVFPSSDDVAGLIYTSGTTGMPKGVILSHGNITSNVNAMHAVFE